MISRNLARRLERVEAQFVPAGGGRVEVLVVEFVAGLPR
jgi:hypothetical protein